MRDVSTETLTRENTNMKSQTKSSNKPKMCISLSENMMKIFKQDCDDKFVKYSNRIEYLISRYLNYRA
jgi:hypothetical protein